MPLLVNVSACSSQLGDYGQAESHARQAEALALELGDALNLQTARINRAEGLLGLGRIEEARPLALAASQALQEAGAPHFVRVGWRLVADIELARADADGLMHAWTQSQAAGRAMHEATDSLALDPEPALAAMLRGQLAQAVSASEAALCSIRAHGDAELALDDFRTWAYTHAVLAAAGDPRAADVLRAALAQVRRMALAIEEPALRTVFLRHYLLVTPLLKAAGLSAQAFLAG